MTAVPIELRVWATRHHVSHEALAELMILTTRPATVRPSGGDGSETYVQSAARLEASRYGIHLWRNNVGALPNPAGVPVRFGLANDNKAINDVLKSGDLIGIRPVTITPAHVGSVIGQFVSRECKPADWRYAGTKREEAQFNWATLINSHGGDAAFLTGPGTFDTAGNSR
jgi:hypothetical protein